VRSLDGVVVGEVFDSPCSLLFNLVEHPRETVAGVGEFVHILRERLGAKIAAKIKYIFFLVKMSHEPSVCSDDYLLAEHCGLRDSLSFQRKVDAGLDPSVSDISDKEVEILTVLRESAEKQSFRRYAFILNPLRAADFFKTGELHCHLLCNKDRTDAAAILPLRKTSARLAEAGV
jgi:hypothetical protein